MGKIMNEYKELFDISKQVQYTPKDSLPIINRTRRQYSNSFESMKDSKLKNKGLNQRLFLLEVSNGYSVESYFFSVFKDKTGFYLKNKNRVNHFHSFENALKYELCSVYSKNYPMENSVEYLCFEYSDISKDTTWYEYKNLAYERGNRIYIK